MDTVKTKLLNHDGMDMDDIEKGISDFLNKECLLPGDCQIQSLFTPSGAMRTIIIYSENDEDVTLSNARFHGWVNALNGKNESVSDNLVSSVNNGRISRKILKETYWNLVKSGETLIAEEMWHMIRKEK